MARDSKDTVFKFNSQTYTSNTAERNCQADPNIDLILKVINKYEYKMELYCKSIANSSELLLMVNQTCSKRGEKEGEKLCRINFFTKIPIVLVPLNLRISNSCKNKSYT